MSGPPTLHKKRFSCPEKVFHPEVDDAVIDVAQDWRASLLSIIVLRIQGRSDIRHLELLLKTKWKVGHLFQLTFLVQYYSSGSSGSKDIKYLLLSF